MMIPETLDFEIRKGDNPDIEMNSVEKSILEQAYNLYTTSPKFSELPLKTIYNFLNLSAFYGTQNPQIIKLLQRLEPYPRMIECEVVQWNCPLKCIHCEIQYDKTEKPMMMSYKDFTYIMDQFDLVWAGNNALGEPWLNPDYPKMIKYLDEQLVPQEVYLTSFLLSEEQMKDFVRMHSFLFTKFSFDAATKETYEKIRVNSNFDKVVRNIKTLDRYKHKKGKHWPQIEFHYLIMQQNIHEAEQFIEFVDSLDIECSGIMFSRLLHNFPGIEDKYMELPPELGPKLIEKGKQFGIPVYFNGDSLSQKPAANTCTQWTMPYIFPDGTVIPCCNGNEAGIRSKQREWSMGNVFTTPFRDIWYGPKYTQLRKTLREGNKEQYMPVCKNLCAVHDINKVSCL